MLSTSALWMSRQTPGLQASSTNRQVHCACGSGRAPKSPACVSVALFAHQSASVSHLVELCVELLHVWFFCVIKTGTESSCTKHIQWLSTTPCIVVTLVFGSSNPSIKTEYPLAAADCSDAVSQMIGAGIAMAILMSFGAVYAAHHRTQIRKKFGIAGSRLEDFCAWYWCGTCALCQETRTLWHNNVVDGVWLGPIKSASNSRAQTLPCYTAPAGTKMSG